MAIEALGPSRSGRGSEGEGSRDIRPVTELDLWASFAGAQQADVFCHAWLGIQCSLIAGSRAALLLMRGRDGVFAPAAVWPDRSRDVQHLVPVAEAALKESTGQVRPPGERGLSNVAYPISVDGELVAVVALDIAARNDGNLTGALRQLHWGAGWLELLFQRERRQGDKVALERSHLALDLVAAASEHGSGGALARAIATELALRFEARSVGIGLVRRGQVRLAALSHAAGFERISPLVGAIENAMDEAVDQAGAVAEPARRETERRISLAHREYIAVSRAAAVVTVPLLSAGRAVGALTLEFDDVGAVEALPLPALEGIGALLGPLFDLHHKQERLVSGRLALLAGKGIQALVGRRRPALKAAAIGLALALAATVLVPASFRITANAVIEGEVQRAAVAPFDGFLLSAPVRAGDTVTEGQPLATLDDRELVLEAARWRSERDQQTLRYQEALGKQERANSRIAEALIRQAEAQLALVQSRIDRAQIKAPLAGLVVSGDLSQQLGTPVERGRVLFEIAPLDRYRVVIQVDERDVTYASKGQQGQLLIKGLTQVATPIRVTAVTPVASAANGKNTFRVEAMPQSDPAGLRPGMEGIAKLEAGDRSLLFIWTRPLMDWLRLTWWTWVT